MSDEIELRDLPPGDIHWDGEILTVGDVRLEPGRYRIPGSDVPLEVVEVHDDPTG